MNWSKMDCGFDHHPQTIQVGWHGRELYLLLIRISRRFDLKGILTAQYVSADFLRSYWGCPQDFPILDALRQCSEAGLLRRVHDVDGFIIDGWQRWNPTEEPGSSTERVRRFREMKRDETKGNDGNERNGRREEKRREESRIDLNTTPAVAVAGSIENSVTELPAVNPPKAKKPRKPVEMYPEPSPEVREVFDYWATTRGKPGVGAPIHRDRQKPIADRLRERYTVALCKQAIDGVAKDPWPPRQDNDGIDKVFSLGNIDKLIGYGKPGAVMFRGDIRKGMVRAEDMGWETFDQSGSTK